MYYMAHKIEEHQSVLLGFFVLFFPRYILIEQQNQKLSNCKLEII